jgi:hypothetical protein
MKKFTITSFVVLAMSCFSMFAAADTLLTTVTNSTSATNGCTVNSIAGGQGWVVYRVACANDTAYTQCTNSSQIAIASGTGYRTSGNCNSYNVYKLTPTSTPSSAQASSTPSYTVINIGVSCNTQVAYACGESFGRTCASAGGSTYTLSNGNFECRRLTPSSSTPATPSSSTPATPSCTILNIGVSCNTQVAYACGESFGRTCASAGGSTYTLSNGNFECRKCN